MTPTHERLIEAHHVASTFYAASLHGPLGAGPRDYLAQRALGSFIDNPAWALGYAPPGWTNLTSHLRQHGFTDTEIAASGLVVTSRTGALLDRFRDRVVVGVHDEHGAPVGFIGRCAPKADGSCAKYLNSPRTPLYAKATVLFGLAEQGDVLASGAIPVIVEGPFDVLAIAALGEPLAAVAPCGTTLRPEQARMLSALAGGTVVVAYDADDAGRRAAKTAYRRLAPEFGRILGAQIPDGEDPASLASTHPASLRRALTGTVPLADQLIDNTLRPFADRLDNAEARACALHAATRLIARLAPGDAGRQVTRVSERLEFEPAEVTRDLVAAVTRRADSSTAPAHRAVVPSQRAPRPAARSIGL